MGTAIACLCEFLAGIWVNFLQVLQSVSIQDRHRFDEHWGGVYYGERFSTR